MIDLELVVVIVDSLVACLFLVLMTTTTRGAGFDCRSSRIQFVRRLAYASVASVLSFRVWQLVETDAPISAISAMTNLTLTISIALLALLPKNNNHNNKTGLVS